MALKKKPVTGMKDILPKEMEIRNYVMNMIRETYGKFGFSSIETPCVEHIENLSSKQGGENEKLIFKILKRGEKLKYRGAASSKKHSRSWMIQFSFLMLLYSRSIPGEYRNLVSLSIPPVRSRNSTSSRSVL